MAATTKKTEATGMDYSTLNVWAKLLGVRSEFYGAGAKKTGRNIHAEFMYFELVDIVPVAEELFAKYGLLLIPSFTETAAVAEVINIHDPGEKITFSILKVLRTNNLSPETDLAELVREAEELKGKLDAHAAEVAEEEKRYKVVTDMIKKAAIGRFREGDKKVSVPGTAFTWEVSRAVVTKIDKDAMKADGVLEKYSYTENGYKLLPKAVKEEK